jgi:excisionase family DNA binding protein
MREERLLTVQEVADHLRVHVKTVLKLISDGKLRAVSIGRRWRIKPDDVRAYLAN